MSDPLSLTTAQVEALNEAETQAVLTAWVAARRAELPTALATSSSKAHARLAKKALYQLKSLGVAIAEAKRPAVASAPVEDETDDLPGVISASVGTGERVALFASPIRGGGIDLYQTILSDEFGIAQFDHAKTNRGTYRNRLRELRAQPEVGVLFVPLPRIVEELGRALSLNERTRTDLPPNVSEQLTRLGVVPLDPDWPVPKPNADDAPLVAEGAALHDDPEIAQWLPPEAELVKLADNPPKAPDERRARANEGVDRFFTPAMRLIYARRLLHTADVFEGTGREALAPIARATGRHLAHLDANTPFSTRLFEKVFALNEPKADPIAELLARAPAAGKLPTPASE